MKCTSGLSEGRSKLLHADGPKIRPDPRICATELEDHIPTEEEIRSGSRWNWRREEAFREKESAEIGGEKV